MEVNEVHDAYMKALEGDESLAKLAEALCERMTTDTTLANITVETVWIKGYLQGREDAVLKQIEEMQS